MKKYFPNASKKDYAEAIGVAAGILFWVGFFVCYGLKLDFFIFHNDFAFALMIGILVLLHTIYGLTFKLHITKAGYFDGCGNYKDSDGYDWSRFFWYVFVASFGVTWGLFILFASGLMSDNYISLSTTIKIPV